MSEVTMEDRAHALENEYFHRQEKELIEKMRAKLASEAKDASHRSCPKCDGKLVETNYEDIKMDVCNQCHGVWLDAGELAQVLHKDEGKGWLGRLFG
jgi:ribosomal protein L31